MANGNLCVRCGHEQEVHDTNLVLETEEYLDALQANEILPPYEMSLLTCSDTKRPNHYTKLLEENFWYLGIGAGYISPYPEAESIARIQYLATFTLLDKGETLFFQLGGPVIATYSGH